MDAQEAPREAPTASMPFVFSSPEGYALCRRILATRFDYEPHDVQVEGVCKLCDGVDVFAILRTGMGKTSFLSMYMVMVLTILGEPSLCPAAAKKFPNNPCMLVILPTKYLEHQMVNNCTKCTLYRADRPGTGRYNDQAGSNIFGHQCGYNSRGSPAGGKHMEEGRY
jgi:hypothetical protein